MRIYLEDPSEFTVGPALSDLGVTGALADLQRAEMTAINLREHAFKEWLEKLADELNSALDGFEVCLVHLDTADYLEFTPKSERSEEDSERS